MKKRMAKVNNSGRFDDRVDLVFDELSMGIQWERPCLVVLFYRSEKIKETVQSMLTGKLKETGHPAISYCVDKGHFDIPLDLLGHPQHTHAVYFINRLGWGGGRGYSNAYRALNMHREYLVEGNIKAIFWLTEKEGRQFSRFAPDFWAFRHKVVDFLDLPSSRNRKQKTPIGSNFHDQIEAARMSTDQGCLEEAILLYRKAFRSQPDEIFIPLKIVEIYLSQGRLPAARNLLDKAGKIKTTDQLYHKELNRLILKSRSVPHTLSGFVENPN
jgi:tetratricopeptide (TPR) repeat protein